jgi:uncharacterized protein (TIGR03083 family)
VTVVEKDYVVAALGETWASIAALCDTLTDEEWARPTDCPGWSVQDQLSHMIGTESALSGLSAPQVDVDRFDYLRNAIGRSNEAWIEERRGRAPGEVLAEFRSITAPRLAVLAAMGQEAFDAESWTPAGQDTYGRFMQIRVMDCWVHEQDMREATNRPGHLEGPAVDVALDEVVTGLGYIVGKQAGAPKGSSVRLVLTGGTSRTVDVVVEDRARVSDVPVTEPTTTITLPVAVFMRLAAGRVPPSRHLADGSVWVAADRALGTQVVEHLAYTI